MRCLYIGPEGRAGTVDAPALAATTERHKIDLSIAPRGKTPRPLEVLAADPSLAGLIIEPETGWLSRRGIGLAGRALRMGRRVWLYFPKESAVEVVDRERLSSHRTHWVVITLMFALWKFGGAVARLLYRIAAKLPQPPRHLLPAILQVAPEQPEMPATPRPTNLDALIVDASPVPFAPPPATPDRRIAGTGVYLRTDFWARIESGGSYGHTCYVAKELAAVTEGFVCFMAHRYRLLDEYGLRQVVLQPPSGPDTEDTIVNATAHYLPALMAACEAIRPAYIYERLCLGNYAGAMLSRRLGIPYIVEYNGSEVSMKRSFEDAGYVYESDYVKAEAFAFAQATMISVISTEVRDSLVARGVDAGKILVNPNGADLTAYAPAAPEEKALIQAEAGLTPGRPVVGFTGTFGGWHGIDVLAAAIPRILARVPTAQFLLIGDGAFKHLVDTAVNEHNLHDRVKSAGRVPQVQGARLLKACDIYVSPHSSHMVDSKFFGSPTKIFEYMAMAGGIVASDLEQIGQILSPALRATDLVGDVSAGEARSVLCQPGNVDDFVEAVVRLLERPALWTALGGNARRAVEEHYSWARHVARLWPFLGGERDAVPVEDLRRKGADAPAVVAPAAGPAPAPAEGPLPEAGTRWWRVGEPGSASGRKAPIATDDPDKDEVQKQWDNDPAGSHYVRQAPRHTLQWFKEAEAYRYGEYAPWMADVMEFSRHAGEHLLEIGGGMGTDLAQFAANGAHITDLDLSSGHLELAQENFRLRGLAGTFVHHDAERLPFDDASFDVVYSNGVIHHTPGTHAVVREIYRVLRPGGKAIIMVYAENSLHYWRNLVWAIGVKGEMLLAHSMGEIMSRAVERSDNASARPLVKVYTHRRLRNLFKGFTDISIVKRQMVNEEKPRLLVWMPVSTLERFVGWNLIIKARKPANRP